MNLIQSAKDSISELLAQAARRAAEKGTLPSAEIAGLVEIPKNDANGDFAANHAMHSARTLHMAPRKIAEEIVNALVLEGSSFEKAEIAGPGFLNFYLSQKWYSRVVQNVVAEDKAYGNSDTGKGERVLVEFVSANPTGPMHVGNARGGAIGDSLASVLQAAGYETEREFYINDAGNQIEKFGKSLSLRYMQLCSEKGQAVMKAAADTEAVCKAVYGENGNTADFPMPEDVYLGQDIIAHAKHYYDLHGDALAAVSDEERRKALAAYALPINIQGLKDDLAQYRIHYDTWFPESKLHQDGSVKQIIEQQTDDLIHRMEQGADPFNEECIERYYHQYLSMTS